MARTLPSYRSREEALFKGKAESVGHGNQACDFMKRQKRTTKGDRLTLSRLVKVKVRVSFNCSTWQPCVQCCIYRCWCNWGWQWGGMLPAVRHSAAELKNSSSYWMIVLVFIFTEGETQRFPNKHLFLYRNYPSFLKTLLQLMLICLGTGLRIVSQT